MQHLTEAVNSYLQDTVYAWMITGKWGSSKTNHYENTIEREIDELVYELYGLSDEEVKVVEEV